MFKFPKNKTVFKKLYRYYCAKLLKNSGLAFFWLLFFTFLMVMWGIMLRRSLDDIIPTWQQKLGTFWFISLFQLVLLFQIIHPLISYLVGRSTGWEALKEGQFFQIPKISREEDAKVLIFTPDADRKTVIKAKFAAAFTYFIAINFFLTFLVFIYFLFFTNFGIIAACLLLLLNGIVFALVNFLLVVPLLFYQQEGGSFLVYLFGFIFIMFLATSFHFLKGFILQYPLVFCLLSIPFSVAVGYLFFSLYWKKFLKNDLD